MKKVSPVEVRLPRNLLSDRRGIEAAILASSEGVSVLRWSIAEATDADLLVEATVSHAELPAWDAPLIGTPGPSVAVHIVPTGVGCAIGGYAGDAGPSTALLASTVDYLVTNPNAVNASDFVATAPNMLYCEGSILDAFCEGHLELYPVPTNRIGLIVEHADQETLNEVAYVTDACRAVHGVDVVEVAVTQRTLGGYVHRMPSGTYSGSLQRTEELLGLARGMVSRGATAIAICSKLRGVDEELQRDHFDGGGEPNPIGGLEASISHLICRNLQVPAAHAPIANIRPGPAPLGPVDARAAGEVVSRTGLACVLVGLGYAPQIRTGVVPGVSAPLSVHNVIAVVAPANSLGGIPVLAAIDRRIPVIAVRDNVTVNRASATDLGMSHEVIEVGSYFEACGVLQAVKNGISLDSIRRPMSRTILVPNVQPQQDEQVPVEPTLPLPG